MDNIVYCGIDQKEIGKIGGQFNKLTARNLNQYILRYAKNKYKR